MTGVKEALLDNIGALPEDFYMEEKPDEVLMRSGGKERVFKKPFRLGAAIDFIEQGKRKALLPLGDYEIDLRGKRLVFTESGEAVDLSDKEVMVLEFLWERGGEAVSREEILEKLWGYSPEANTRTVETHMHRLRQKFASISYEPSEILVFDGGGYRLQPLR